MVTARVLVVEDDPAISSSLVGSLTDAGYRARGLPDGRDLEGELESFRPDLVVLDWMLPGRDGPALARVVRARSGAGIILLTARDEMADRLAGFDAGVDDYVVKPFVVAEVLARMRAVLRRSGALDTVQVDDLVVDPSGASVTRGGVPLELTATEMRLLFFLAENRDRVMSTVQILTQVWGYEDYADNLVQVHVSALRRKLEAHGPRLLHTVRGMGYVLRSARSAEQAR
ncbi:response regulator transcription factor [Microlunatus capsulatus]|uniref:DNA-binding response OmpR family regulator n=1 Tax=Microlunatus capsulatus TaxID=99117 RepID=A0ABS4Z4V1_9ACTN|nr:response regulator transcription factor [Microlunatus capsulatus]MBP2415994.1 DNA-binding response OmpR family regulator [Microlunatus capsulatus]